MTLTKAIVFLGVIGATLGFPLNIPRDGGSCYPVNGIIDYPDPNCPKKATLDKNGHCTKAIPDTPDAASGLCTAYCEQTISFQYGPEIPFHEGYCQANETCSVDTGESVTTTNTYSINVGLGLGSTDEVIKTLTGSFDLGASYSYSTSVSYSTTIGHGTSGPLDATTCGYWTFIPFTYISCGVLTNAQTITDMFTATQMGNTQSKYDCDPSHVTDQKNWCNRSLYKDSNGHSDGKVVFVLVDCNGGGVLTDGQDPAYNYPGVSTGPRMSKN